METTTDRTPLEALVARLSRDFPAATVASIVAEEYDRLAGARVTTYVPVLVERAARERLRATSAPASV